jgi:uncharacterized protein YlxP (DUF503 family)
MVRPVVAELRRRFDVASAETGNQELHRRAEVSVALVSGDHGQVREILDGCERLLAARPELELLAVRRRVLDSDDLD